MPLQSNTSHAREVLTTKQRLDALIWHAPNSAAPHTPHANFSDSSCWDLWFISTKVGFRFQNVALIAQLGERQTEDLKVAGSSHESPLSSRRGKYSVRKPS
jgi:hypothetical protein